MGKQRFPKPDPRLKHPELKPKSRFRAQDRQTRLRKSISPGAVCVCVIGPYTSKKVVVLKQLGSGLILGSCQNNGAVRRFPQKWLHSVGEKINLNGKVNGLLGKWDDSSFDCLKTKKPEGGEDSMFGDVKSGSAPAEFQSAVDAMNEAVDSSVDDKYMKMFLKARFTIGSSVGVYERVH